jgi:hypothetical protein
VVSRFQFVADHTGTLRPSRVGREAAVRAARCAAIVVLPLRAVAPARATAQAVPRGRYGAGAPWQPRGARDLTV